MGAEFHGQPFTIQQLTVEDVEVFKSIRLEALNSDPGNFGSSFEIESVRTDREWLEILEDQSRAHFALKSDNVVVGLTGVITCREDATCAKLIASYIRKDYRRMGGSELLYRVRIDWARRNNFKAIIVSHRESNLASKMANQKHGFIYTHSEPHTWNDGVTEDELFYRLELSE